MRECFCQLVFFTTIAAASLSRMSRMVCCWGRIRRPFGAALSKRYHKNNEIRRMNEVSHNSVCAVIRLYKCTNFFLQFVDSLPVFGTDRKYKTCVHVIQGTFGMFSIESESGTEASEHPSCYKQSDKAIPLPESVPVIPGLVQSYLPQHQLPEWRYLFY